MNNLNKRNKYLFNKFFSFKYIKSGLAVLVCLLNSNAYLQETDSLFPQKYYYNSGSISSEGTLENGVPQGNWRNYYEDGILKSEGKKLDGKSVGEWTFYAPDGKKEKRITYDRNLKNGSYQQFDSLGLVKMEQWYTNDTLQGVSRTFIQGRLQAESIYVNGRKEGIEKIYDDKDGRVIETIQYNAGEPTSRLALNRFSKDNKKTGLWRTYYPDGRMQSECLYDKDVVIQDCKTWNEKGILVRKNEGSSEFKEMPEVRQQFHPNGTLASFGAYSGKSKNGVFSAFDSTGRLLGSEIYEMDTLRAQGFVLPDGVYDSSWVYLYPNGQKSSQGKYKDGVKTGLWTFYNSQGKVIQKGYYRRGYVDGEWNWYYANGQLRRKESYVRGILEGLKTEYDSTGNKLTEGNYINDLPNGPWFYHVDEHMEKGTYNMGQKTGVWKYYYREETLKFKGAFKDDKPLGRHVIYHTNGKVSEIGKYKNGLKHKDWKVYDEKGNLLHVYAYKNGVMMAVDGEYIKKRERR